MCKKQTFQILDLNPAYSDNTINYKIWFLKMILDTLIWVWALSRSISDHVFHQTRKHISEQRISRRYVQLFAKLFQTSCWVSINSRANRIGLTSNKKSCQQLRIVDRQKHFLLSNLLWKLLGYQTLLEVREIYFPFATRTWSLIVIKFLAVNVTILRVDIKIFGFWKTSRHW